LYNIILYYCIENEWNIRNIYIGFERTDNNLAQIQIGHSWWTIRYLQ